MISHLPLYDVPMLVSTVNCLLRDREFDNLNDMCGYFEVSRDEVEKILASAYFKYDEDLNKII